ncbi:MAG: Rrf2 family transcriptional regulator [Endomicrobium sp.]|jgi:Rrf2 family protein|nr:Rrf2 family transcriptional regulator [Endomicrobium sp.]
MKLSTKTRYGTRAMLELADNYGGKVSPVNVIAKNQSISERYLQNILLILVNAGLVKSVRGKKGGFVLAKDPSEISLAEIVLALEEDKLLFEAYDEDSSADSSYEKSSICVMSKVWEMVSEQLHKFLSEITLSQLARMKSEKEFGEKILDFCI